MELGALDGKMLSNTLWFEKVLNWRGLLIEVNPGVPGLCSVCLVDCPSGPGLTSEFAAVGAERLGFRDLIINRPRAICVHSAVCSEFKTVHYVEHPLHKAADGIWEFMEPGFKNNWYPNTTVEDLPEVSCVPLMFILDR